MRVRRIIWAGVWLAAAGLAAGDTVTGTGWKVVFNRPDQTTSLGSIGAEEFAIRDAWLARIDSLESGDWAGVSTYTFSGNTAEGGAAGPILAALERALDRGAAIGFIADKSVNTASNYWPEVSLEGLAARGGNALELSQGPAGWGIMHDKLGVFWDASAGEGWVLTGSWNFTGGASSLQWNILLALQDNGLAAACSNELRELLSGRFHSDASKSHAHDGARFQAAGMADSGWVRFSPYPDGRYGGSNALTDITAAIDAAQEEIFFALNKLTRRDVAEALIRACDRGVVVAGTIPKSDWLQPWNASHEMVQLLRETDQYATRNRVRLLDAYYDAAHSKKDNNNRDLVHAKYMVIDPRGARPLVIHGSANWTASGLVLTSSNDENVLFVPHAGVAAAFLAQFGAMTDGLRPWAAWRREGAVVWLDYWLPDGLDYELAWTERLGAGAAWTNAVQPLPAGRGTNAVAVSRPGPRGFVRIQAAP